MIDSKKLLADLKRLRTRTEADLRQYHAASAGRAAVEAEWREAFEARRTADSFLTFWNAALDQSAVHWILGLVFLRFLEDNRLVDAPLLSGPGERLELAELRQRDYFRAAPHDSDAEFLLATFAQAAELPGLTGLFDPAHNPLFRLPVSGDGAMALLAFFRTRVPETGALVHDFTDPDWNTRFLGDLYQDLSEDARKRYALLQTPDFVEEWILSRTLDPAIKEFGFEHARMIDPACGSGHFLLGGFALLLAEWQRHRPDMPPAAQAQQALDAVSGVDLNPFAVEIARFRLLLAALRAAEKARLREAPDFRFSLAVGDSLFHGTHFFRAELGGGAEGFGRRMRHHYLEEDTRALDVILGRQYHAVVGNPPYIVPRDSAMREAYREIYPSCHRQYGLGVPFIERFFDLTLAQGAQDAAGFVGLIVANSFMKREFGKKLIEEVLPKHDLTHVVDCSGAYIPGHGTPTVILFGRNRAPTASVVRAVMGIRGEPEAPENPAYGLVWSAIVAQIDRPSSISDFLSVADTKRQVFAQHPWSIGGGGIGDAMLVIQKSASGILASKTNGPIGGAVRTGADEVFSFDLVRTRQSQLPPTFFHEFLSGDEVRDWADVTSERVYYPYNDESRELAEEELWPWRTTLALRATFQGIMEDSGLSWTDYMQHTSSTYRTPLSITFAEVATHNHFVLDRGGKVFKQTAPVIKLPAESTEVEHLGLLGLLNASTACFWLKQVCHNKGATVDDRGARQRTDPFEDFYQLNGTRVGQFPVADDPPIEMARALDAAATAYTSNLPAAICARATPTLAALESAHDSATATRATMIALQEELDWRCYRLYALHDDPPEHPDPPGLRLGERAFEIVMARRMAAGELETAWFTRHNSKPITEPPSHWPDDYRAVVERRIAIIETDPTIGLIERPEYKRRWSSPSWEEMEHDALRTWLLDWLEDPRHWPRDNPAIMSTTALADSTRRDADFQSVAALYTGRDAFDLEALVAELVARESVPFLAALRYSESGLRKRAEWEATWDKQRQEDAIDAQLAASRPDFVAAAWTRANPRAPDETPEAYAARLQAGCTTDTVQQAAEAAIAQEAKRRKRDEVGAIPVPPKYRTPDFVSQDFWRLRGGLDVPKERFVSFPHAARDADPALPVLWAGHDHLGRARALSAWYVERKDTDGWATPRLVPLLAGLLELVPWLVQWHNGIDAETGLRMGDFFAEFVQDEARSVGLTLADLRAWTPPAPTRRPRRAASAGARRG